MSMPTEPSVQPGGAPNSTTVIPPAPPVVIPSPPASQYFTAEQVEAIRQQEKDKLYAKQEQLAKDNALFRTELETLKASEVTRAAELKAREDDVKAAAKREEESKLTAQQLIEAREVEFNQRQEALRSELDLKIATMQKEQEFLKVTAYTQRRVAEEIAADSIIPDLVEYIGGNTEEEIEASITKAREKTASILEGASRMTGPAGPGNGVSTTGFGPAGPLDAFSAPGNRELSPQEIANMNMEEYARYRVSQGINKAGQHRGLFS